MPATRVLDDNWADVLLSRLPHFSRLTRVSGLVSDAVGDEWRHYPLGWHWVLVLFGGLVLFPLAAGHRGNRGNSS